MHLVSLHVYHNYIANMSSVIYDDFVDIYDIPEHDFYPSQAGGQRTGKKNKTSKKPDNNIYGNKHVRIALARLHR